MNQQSILSSNLLDIIFENRNKEYGAYKLRKSYESRLSIAVFSTAGIALVFSLLLLSQSHSGSLVTVSKTFPVPDLTISHYSDKKAIVHKQILPPAAIKNNSRPNTTPVIVPSEKINILPATQPDVATSITSIESPDIDGIGAVTGESGTGKDSAATVQQPAIASISAPVEIAEIMPQYPGGIKALLAFLKKNIHAPETINDGDDVGVEVQFVVNYNGNLENFNVTKSGGEVFDNEVLRVLKKMPAWIPGKTAGKNIPVYYRVPVKFTGEF